MRNRPSGTELLDIAREVLREKLIPDLGPDQRYDALMVANAMAIVMRQMEAGEQTTADERKALSEHLGREGTLESLNRELALRIRNGHTDGTEIWRTLHMTALARVSESNPKYL